MNKYIFLSSILKREFKKNTFLHYPPIQIIFVLFPEEVLHLKFGKGQTSGTGRLQFTNFRIEGYCIYLQILGIFSKVQLCANISDVFVRYTCHVNMAKEKYFDCLNTRIALIKQKIKNIF